MSAAWMRASAGVKDGIVRYLCLKNTGLHIRVCLVSMIYGEIGRIYTHIDFDIPMYTPIISTFIFVTLFFDHWYNSTYWSKPFSIYSLSPLYYVTLLYHTIRYIVLLVCHTRVPCTVSISHL